VHETETVIKKNEGSLIGGLLLLSVVTAGFVKREKIKVFLKNIFE